MKHALEIIEGGGWFGPIRFITANVHKKTGGEVIEISKARIARNRTSERKEMIRQAQHDTKRRDANHNANFTRNIELKNGSIRTIHPILITHLNGMAVL